MKWIVGQPGGMNGPFYSVVAENGNVIAMQIPSEKNAKTIAGLGACLDYDFDKIHEAGIRLRRIFDNDEIREKDISKGLEDYIIRSVILALFADEYIAGLID